MPKFTVEMTYRLPVYRQETYEAPTLEAAIAMARADDNWDSSKNDYDCSGGEYVSGAWNGDDAYSGDNLFSEPEPHR